MGKIIIIGSSNTDMVIKAPKLPLPGETVMGGKFLMNPGGKGANQAVTSARLGCPTVFICKVGNDVFGKMALQQFEKEGIQTDFVFTDAEQPSGVALINVDMQGENCITVAPGANAFLSPANIDKASAIFEKDDLILMQLETPLETVEYVVNKFHQTEATIILNPAPATPLKEEILKYLTVITPNETEAEILTGISVVNEDGLRKAANILREKGVKNVVITRGSKGAYILSDEFEGMVASVKVEAVDTTAAGDCFNGALAVGLFEKMSLKEAVQFACKAAAASVKKMGAQSSIPYRKELMVS
ncbi:ribokinase [Arcicella lustrica]|uniref:Ribokinase n=1 Tax=Arcicella lustrica TaxID=2984196 RepID=A0ABU5SL22_9BACT|nr:ribokinase [Arcicella sp. DC25W]MEA5427992.1 ribokinase [Arcicella sp. DC25W]